MGFDDVLERIRSCRICIERPSGTPLPHEPRPVLQPGREARILIAGQAPGVRVHASGRPFTDPSGVRLREWLGVGEAEFYDPEPLRHRAHGILLSGPGQGGLRPAAEARMRASLAGAAAWRRCRRWNWSSASAPMPCAGTWESCSAARSMRLSATGARRSALPRPVIPLAAPLVAQLRLAEAKSVVRGRASSGLAAAGEGPSGPPALKL